MKNLVNIGHLPPRLGGSAMVNEELVRGLSIDHGWNIRLISHGMRKFEEAGMLTDTLPGSSIPISWFVMDYMPAHEDPPIEYTEAKNVAILSKFRDITSEFAPDAIMVGHECYAWVIPQLKQEGLPIILVTHGTPTHGLSEGIYSQANTQRFLDSMGAADTVVAVSAYMKQILEGYGLSNVEVVHNGIDTTMFSPGRPNEALRAELGLNPGDIVVSHYSNMRPIKRLQDLVEAARIVSYLYDNVKYIVVGDGPCRPEIENLVHAYDLDASFRFLGKRPREEVPDLMRLSHIIASTSEREGFGRVIREGQACGRIVVASGAGPTCELIRNGEDGLMYAAGDVSALADAILEVAKGSVEAEYIGRNGIQTARASNLQAQIANYNGVLESLTLQQLSTNNVMATNVMD